MYTPFRQFRTATTGVASIEFALLSTVLLILFAGGFDLVYMVGARRDADRAAVLVAHAMATCPTSSCIPDLIYTYIKRETNALVRYPSAKIDLYMIQRQNGQIQTCNGTQKLLTDSDVIASAKNILQDNDVGTAVILTTTYTSILPNALMSYISASGVTYRRYAVDVMSNVGPLC